MDHRNRQMTNFAFLTSTPVLSRGAFLSQRPRLTNICASRPSRFQMSINGAVRNPPLKIARNYVTRDPSGIPVVNIDGLSNSGIPKWLLLTIVGIIVWLYRRYRMMKYLSIKYKRQNLSKDIADFYDYRSAAWEDVWGEHMHHGLYDVVDGKKISGREAQVRTMTELLAIGGLLDSKLPRGARILDVGCGIGGASRFLARHFGPDVQVTGITLSPVQATRAMKINYSQGLDRQVTNQVRNALDTGFPDNHFDMIWSLESGEHMEDKQQFLKECGRVLKPGGKMVMLAWCIRESTPPLKLSERYSIRRIMDEYCLPRVAPPSEYETEMIRAGFRGTVVSDWTPRAAPFWGEVVRSAVFNPKGWKALFRYGWPLIRSALAMRHVIAGIRLGVFRIVAFAGSKMTPEQIEKEAQLEGCCVTKTLRTT